MRKTNRIFWHMRFTLHQFTEPIQELIIFIPFFLTISIFKRNDKHVEKYLIQWEKFGKITFSIETNGIVYTNSCYGRTKTKIFWLMKHHMECVYGIERIHLFVEELTAEKWIIIHFFIQLLKKYFHFFFSFVFELFELLSESGHIGNSTRIPLKSLDNLNKIKLLMLLEILKENWTKATNDIQVISYVYLT